MAKPKPEEFDEANAKSIDEAMRRTCEHLAQDLTKRSGRPLAIRWERWGGGCLIETNGSKPPAPGPSLGPLADLVYAPKTKDKELSDTIPPVSLLRFLEGFAAGFDWRK